MGNQASLAPGGRSACDKPPHIPPHTPQSRRERKLCEEKRITGPGIIIDAVRKLSGGDGTPGTYETPPCISVRVGRDSVLYILI